ncbi:MAG: hypothetical protein KDJ14_15975 [Xanthomonadales bacterium]|nr:hypothetical protein [Xanthomonadales bacterium]
MRRIFGIFLQLVGWLAGLWCALVGGSFCLVYLMGFVGTGGREAGGELAVMFGLTLFGALAGYLLARWGRYLSAPRTELAA